MNKLQHTIKQGITGTFFVWKQELKNIFHDAGVLIFFFVVPLVYPVLYGLIYNPETVHEVPLVIVDDSGTSLSREFIRKIDASSDVKVVSRCSNMGEAKQMINRKEAYGVLYFPSSFSKDLNSGKQTGVSLYCDMGSILYYKAFLLATTEVSLEMGQEIYLTPETVTYESIAMYNSANGFASFLVPAILILVIQQTLLLGIGMLAGTARERNSTGSIIPSLDSYRGTLRVVFGKSLAYFFIYILMCFWVLSVVPYLFDFPQIAPYGDVTLFVLPYLFACIFFSMTLSCLIKGRETPMLIFVFTSVPLLFISGISWPASAIPQFWQWLGTFFPSTIGIQGFVKLNTMGASLSEVGYEYKMLWLQAGIYFIAACLAYRYEVGKLKNANSDKVTK